MPWSGLISLQTLKVTRSRSCQLPRSWACQSVQEAVVQYQRSILPRYFLKHICLRTLRKHIGYLNSMTPRADPGCVYILYSVASWEMLGCNWNSWELLWLYLYSGFRDIFRGRGGCNRVGGGEWGYALFNVNSGYFL